MELHTASILQWSVTIDSRTVVDYRCRFEEDWSRAVREVSSSFISCIASIYHSLFSEILLLVNLCVSLANAYITPLPLSPEEARLLSNAENVPAPQPAAPAPRKGAKSDQPPAGGAGGPSGTSSTAVKNDDLKAALEVSGSLPQMLGQLRSLRSIT